MPKSVKNAMSEITNEFGHAEPVLHLAASLGWNAKWMSQVEQEYVAKVVKLLTEAGEMLRKLEADEEEMRKLCATHGKKSR